MDSLGRHDAAGDETKLSIGLGEPLGPAVELLSKDAEGFRDDLCGDGEVDLTIDSEVEELLRLAPNCNALTRTLVSATTRFTNVCGILGRPAR